MNVSGLHPRDYENRNSTNTPTGAYGRQNSYKNKGANVLGQRVIPPGGYHHRNQ